MILSQSEGLGKMALGIVKNAYDRSSQLFGVIWFTVSLSWSVVVDQCFGLQEERLQMMLLLLLSFFGEIGLSDLQPLKLTLIFVGFFSAWFHSRCHFNKLGFMAALERVFIQITWWQTFSSMLDSNKTILNVFWIILLFQHGKNFSC